MIEREVEILTAAGAMNSFVVHPEEGGPHPVVLFYMDAPGKREELHDMARRIAAVGYYVVLPNLYYRKTREFRLVRDEEGMARMFAMMGHLSNGLIVQDTRALLDFVDTQPQADASRIGAVGYCMSGPFVLAAAAHYPDRLRCAASIYGTKLVTERDDSPHRLLERIRCEIYLACAETDSYVPASMVEAFAEAAKKAGTRCRIEWYPGTQHGFAFPQREGAYDKPSAERHWERLFALFERSLRR